MLSITEAAKAIETLCSAHAELALPTDVEASPAAGGAVFQVVRQACLRLGFIAIDADCIAAAWQQQSDRTGRFDLLAWPQEPQDFGLPSWPREGAFASCPRALGLYAVLPDAAWVARMADAGVPTLQLRFKSDDAQAVEREVRAAVRAVQGTGSLLFINDHWKVAIDVGAYGVHLGQEDVETLSGSDLACLRGAGLRLGLSTHGYAEMLRADRYSPSYLALGAVFPTTLKRMATAPQGTGRLKRYAQLMRSYPLVAIGGVDPDRLSAVMASGVGSVAMVRALLTSPDPQATAKLLMQQVAALSLVPAA
jgi:thiamine-phosphate pyrophosphorylase